jgi:Ca2+-binding EF-hand superfamily protein
MKFAIAALLGLVTVKAVSLHQMKNLVQVKHEGEPSPDQIWAMCDTNGDDNMTREEADACVLKAPEDLQEDLTAKVAKLYEEFDTDNNGITREEFDTMKDESHGPPPKKGKGEEALIQA